MKDEKNWRADDLAGAVWWNGLTEGQRRYWLEQAGEVFPVAKSPADAWTEFKLQRFAGFAPRSRPAVS